MTEFPRWIAWNPAISKAFIGVSAQEAKDNAIRCSLKLELEGIYTTWAEMQAKGWSVNLINKV